MLLAAGAIGALTSCAADDAHRGADLTATGRIAPAPELDVTVAGDAPSRSASQLTASDLELTLTSDRGVERHYPSVHDFDTDEEFAVGAYTLRAHYGSVTDEGFDKPCYDGSAHFAVTRGETTTVALTATLANCMVSVAATDAVAAYLADWGATLHGRGAAACHSVASGEARPIYMAPGTIDVTADLTMADGRHVSLSAGSFRAEPRHHYHITLDLATGPGDATLVVNFDETLRLEPVQIILSDDLIDAPAPEAALEGATDGTPLEMVATSHPASDVSLWAASAVGLRSLVLTTTAPSLQEHGWPAEVDLLASDPATLASLSAMRALGLVDAGLTGPSPRYAAVALTETLPLLRDDQASFTLRATDRYGKTSPARTLSVSLTPLLLDITDVTTPEFFATELQLTVASNSDAPASALRYMVTDTSGQWQQASVSSASVADAAAGTHRVSLQVPEAVYKFSVKVATEAAESRAVEVTRTLPDVTLTCDKGDAWAHKALVPVSCPGVPMPKLLEYATIHVAEGSSGQFALSRSKPDASGLLTLEDLKSYTTYRVRLSLTGSADTPCGNQLLFTTEAAAQVPNGDFEQLRQTIDMTLMQGGWWTMTAIGSWIDTKMEMLIKEPTGWASTNAKTCYPQATNQNTWYQVPSVYNTTLTWISHQPTAKIMGIGQSAYDIVPDVYADLTAASGSNAMVVRNVAWDPAGEDIQVMKQTGNTDYSNYYCANIPNIANRSAGRLFLGHYSYNGARESITEGTSFTSRPAALTGSYKYEPDPNDPSEAGTVTVQLLNGTTVIGRGEAQLPAAASYTGFSVPVTYSVTNRRATSLRIMICSSNHTSEADIVTTPYCGKPECTSRGAALTIDNLKFTY